MIKNILCFFFEIVLCKNRITFLCFNYLLNLRVGEVFYQKEDAYSSVPNRSAGPNKRAGGRIS